ncbi:MAG: sulfoxide reductase heme-binding subunit YedZ [Gammaproteobacteria bacterium]|nr:sulfoxide reductase heme-binding subunit YedZ [Gammaproteobacteria bacterium]
MREPRFFGLGVIVLACLPMLFGILAVASDLLLHTRYFGSNPIKAGEHFLGDWTLRLLVATLAITPLRRTLHWIWLVRHRRTLGLFAFGYLMLHWLTYAVLDVQLDWTDLVRDLMKRPYIMIGMAALVMMIPLAITSTRRMVRRLGRNWQRLHRLVYVIAIFGVIHFWMSVKKDISEPLLYAVIFGALFAHRIPYAIAHRRAAAKSAVALGRS